MAHLLHSAEDGRPATSGFLRASIFDILEDATRCPRRDYHNLWECPSGGDSPAASTTGVFLFKHGADYRPPARWPSATLS
jgi:hypothetical protein